MNACHLASGRAATAIPPAPGALLLHRLRPLARFVIRRRVTVARARRASSSRGNGPVIFAGNHVGVIDGPLLAIFAPRPVHALTKLEMFKGGMGRFLLGAGQIPLDRFNADPARGARPACGCCATGGAVGIFPEGSRGAGELERFHRGAAYLAMVTGAPSCR